MLEFLLLVAVINVIELIVIPGEKIQKVQTWVNKQWTALINKVKN